MPSYELLAAYCRTDYRVELPNRNFSIRLGSRSRELDEFLTEAGRSRWAIITAENPQSAQLSEIENADRREALRRLIDEAEQWDAHPTVAVCPQSEWPPERGRLIMGISEQDALTLARRFGQHAILWGAAGRPAALRLTDAAAWRPSLDRGVNSNDDLMRKICEELICEQFCD